MLALANVLRSLEHHVFEQMREASAPRTLIPGPNVIDHVGSQHWRTVIWHQQYAQPVVQAILGKLHARQPRRIGGETTACEQKRKQQKSFHSILPEGPLAHYRMVTVAAKGDNTVWWSA